MTRRHFVHLMGQAVVNLQEISLRAARNYWAHSRTRLYHEITVHVFLTSFQKYGQKRSLASFLK